MTSIFVYTSKIYEMIIVFPLRFLVNLFIWFHLLSLCFRWPSVLNWTYQPRLFCWYLVQKSWCHLNLRVIVTFCTLYAPAWNISFRVLVSSQALSNIPIRDSNVILFSWCFHNITEFFPNHPLLHITFIHKVSSPEVVLVWTFVFFCWGKSDNNHQILRPTWFLQFISVIVLLLLLSRSILSVG